MIIELRCSCGKKLADVEASYAVIQIKCPRCKALKKFVTRLGQLLKTA